MTNSNQDIRVQKTQLALSKTLLELLEKKSFQKITVNDICQSAMVSRSTFYLHFEDKYRLLLFCLQIERQKLEEVLKRSDPREFIKSVLITVREREKTYRNFFSTEINLELIRMLQNFFFTFFFDMLTAYERQGGELAGPTALVAVFYANGLAGMVMWWIEKDFPVSVDEMARCQHNLLSGILSDDSNGTTKTPMR